MTNEKEAGDAPSEFGNTALLIFALERDIVRLLTGAERPLMPFGLQQLGMIRALQADIIKTLLVLLEATTKIDREEWWKDSDCVL